MVDVAQSVERQVVALTAAGSSPVIHPSPFVKQKVLFLDHSPILGGAQIALADHLKYLGKEKFEAIVVCGRNQPELVTRLKDYARIYPVEFDRLKVFSPFLPLRFVKTFCPVFRIVRRERPALIVTNTERAFYIGALTAVLTNTNLIVWLRDFLYCRLLLGTSLPVIDKIVGVSRAVGDFYHLTNNPKFAAVYVGSDFDEKLKKVPEAEIARLRSEFGLQNQDLIIGYVGRLVPGKGPQILLEAFHRLVSNQKINNNDQTLKLVFVGSGRGQPESNEEELKSKAKSLNLDNRVVFSGQREDVPVFLRFFDIFVAPFVESEPLGTVIFEAMLAGLPIITTKLGGTAEIISDKETGFLIPAGDIEALVQKLSELIALKKRNPILLQKVGSNARSKALTKYSEPGQTKKMEAIYQEVIL